MSWRLSSCPAAIRSRVLLIRLNSSSCLLIALSCLMLAVARSNMIASMRSSRLPFSWVIVLSCVKSSGFVVQSRLTQIQFLPLRQFGKEILRSLCLVKAVNNLLAPIPRFHNLAYLSALDSAVSTDDFGSSLVAPFRLCFLGDRI